VKARYDRTIYEIARIPDAHKVVTFHIPLTVDGYRTVCKGTRDCMRHPPGEPTGGNPPLLPFHPP
jgi:hypothetical protein